MNCRQYQFSEGRFPRHDGSTCGPAHFSTGDLDTESCLCGCTAFDEFCHLCYPEERRYVVHKNGHPAWPPGNVGALWTASELNILLNEHEGSGTVFHVESPWSREQILAAVEEMHR